MTKQTQAQVKAALDAAKSEISRLEKAVDQAVTTKDATDCTCNNPGCSGSEPVSYAAAVAGAFAGGVSG
ncbi:MAG: hypothetical protein ACRBBV_01545 [Paracoccaceae bacterium]